MALPEPVHLVNLEGELVLRWPMTSLLDVLKETDLRVGITPHFASLTSHEALDPERLQRRLLLCLYGLGTNTGLKRVTPESKDVHPPNAWPVSWPRVFVVSGRTTRT